MREGGGGGGGAPRKGGGGGGGGALRKGGGGGGGGALRKGGEGGGGGALRKGGGGGGTGGGVKRLFVCSEVSAGGKGSETKSLFNAGESFKARGVLLCPGESTFDTGDSFFT